MSSLEGVNLVNSVRPHMFLKHERKTLGHAVVFLLAMLASSAISKDFGILTRMLYAAFLAEQGVAVCTVADPAFASATSGPMGYMRNYVQRIKAEVTAGLRKAIGGSQIKTHTPETLGDNASEGRACVSSPRVNRHKPVGHRCRFDMSLPHISPQ
jgi:hypothetical protein